MLNRDRLVKMLELTSSDSDAEALAAVRKANGLLKREGLRWGNLFDLVRREQEPVHFDGVVKRPARGPVASSEVISEILRCLAGYRRLGGVFTVYDWDWYRELEAEFARRGTLSQKQLSILADILA